MLGGRFDSFDITVVDVDDAVTTSRKDEEFSPRAGIIFKPQENTSLFVSYSESFLPRSGEQFKNYLHQQHALTLMYLKTLKLVSNGIFRMI